MLILHSYTPEEILLNVIGTNLKTFAPYYSQSPPAADVTPHDFLRLEISTGTTESGWQLGYVYIIFLFIFKSSIVLALIIFYL
jgi:hypothetical protein